MFLFNELKNDYKTIRKYGITKKGVIERSVRLNAWILGQFNSHCLENDLLIIDGMSMALLLFMKTFSEDQIKKSIKDLEEESNKESNKD